ncbi:saccharopine dehydrogenase [Auriculariales sp. MPI-PUGE-AT-0066]|nr:saccharopine dehydrogenase [Auriculariales sp. MPI-PUGE-AT-0066]
MSLPSVDVLLIGGTGYTGKLILRYLASHPERESFKLGVTVRSLGKGRDLLNSLSLSESQATLYELDVSDVSRIEDIVACAKVVINAVGPFWLYSTPVIKACARLGINYVDITGETFWIYKILNEVDTLASRSGAIIIPSCGFDSVPADLSAFLSVRTLQQSCAAKGIPWPGATTSETGLIGKLTPSGGSLATMLLAFSIVPRDILSAITKSYCLSPVIGLNQDVLVTSGKSAYLRGRYKSLYPLATSDRAIVLRSWGLFALQDQGLVSGSGSQTASYGDKFTYEEFFALKSGVAAFFRNAFLVLAGVLLLAPPVRWLISKVSPAGSGPPQQSLEQGRLKVVNVTRLDGEHPVDARTEIVFHGDAGYLGTSVIISEAALLLLRTPRDRLSPFARQGGLLTSATALGSLLAERLSQTRFIDISSTVVSEETLKTR